MNEADRKTFTQAMLDCYDLKMKEPNTRTIDLYFKLLSDYALDSVLNAIENVLKTSSYFPQPNLIIEQIEGKEDIIIDAAYETAKRYWQEIGFYEDACFDDQLITETIKAIGGIQTFCEGMDMDKEKNDSKMWFEFKRNYSRFLRLKKDNKHVPSVGLLAGYRSLNNNTYVDKVLPKLLFNNQRQVTV